MLVKLFLQEKCYVDQQVASAGKHLSTVFEAVAYDAYIGCSKASPAISQPQKTALSSAGSLSKHPGEPMKNILFALRHPLFYWRSHKAMRGFDRLFGPYGKVPF